MPSLWLSHRWVCGCPNQEALKFITSFGSFISTSQVAKFAVGIQQHPTNKLSWETPVFTFTVCIRPLRSFHSSGRWRSSLIGLLPRRAWTYSNGLDMMTPVCICSTISISRTTTPNARSTIRETSLRSWVWVVVLHSVFAASLWGRFCCSQDWIPVWLSIQFRRPNLRSNWISELSSIPSLQDLPVLWRIWLTHKRTISMTLITFTRTTRTKPTKNLTFCLILRRTGAFQILLASLWPASLKLKRKCLTFLWPLSSSTPVYNQKRWKSLHISSPKRFHSRVSSQSLPY